MEEDIIEMREILDEINERYKGTSEAAVAKTGEIFPTDTAPILIAAENKPQVRLMKWGFPKWQASGVIINARGETVHTKLPFRPSLASRRCTVPTTGFFEWRKDVIKKGKYLFRMPQSKMLYLAGLYGIFQDGPRSWAGYVILTGPANASVSPYHDRMPLVLLPDEIEPWLADAAFARTFVQRPCEVALEAIPV
jgi:putative SOS response-associated peptidase YedK